MKSKILCALGISAALLTGCGSSGGDDGGVVVDPVDLPPIILSTYNFEIGGLGQAPDLLVDAGGQFEVAVDFGDTLRGSTDLQSLGDDEVIFERFTTDAGSSMDITVSRSQTTLDGSFSINVTEDVYTHFGLGTIPLGGAFEVVTPTETVTVTVATADGFPVGVEMSLNGGAAVSFAWQEYEDLLDDPLAETWQRRASLAGAVYAFVFERVFEIASRLDELEITASINPIVIGQLAQIWDEMVPGEIRDHTALDSFHRGVLTVVIDSPSTSPTAQASSIRR